MLESEPLSGLAPFVTALPPAADGDVFTPDQWSTLLAICEVFFPSIPNHDAGDDGDVSEYTKSQSQIQQYLPADSSPGIIDNYLGEKLSRDDVKESLRRKVGMYIPKSQVEALAFVFSALNTRAGSYIMTGYTTPLQDQSIEKRSEIVCKWATSYLRPLRAIFSSMEVLAKVSWLTESKTLHKVTGFPIVGDHIERNEGFQFDFKSFDKSTAGETVELEYDVVIVGSGCGAGVMASHLGRAAAKMDPSKRPKIVVLEKGYHFPSSHFPMSTAAASEHLIEGGGGLQSNDGSIAVIAGATWGGGGTVNWSASLQPQSFVREEWANKDGLDIFTTGEFQDCLDTVCERMGVCKLTDEAGKAQIPHNFGNEKLLEGARRLGLAVEVVPQNSASKAHKCGHCSEGCASATKQGPANCWLPDAAQNGVEFIEGCFAEEILWDSESKASQPKKAIGLRVEWKSRDHSWTRKLFIKSKRIVVSAGTLQSPALLLRSGITNRHVGANLHLHPTMCVGTVWPDRVDPWIGPILTTAVTAKENFDGEGHGPKVELVCGTLSWMLPWTPWNPNLTIDGSKSSSSRTDSSKIFASAIDYKTQVAKFGHTAGFIAIQRDRDTGRVYLEPKDPQRRQLRISYNASPRDRQGLLEGVIVAARVAYVEGATEIRPYNYAIPPFVRSATAGSSVNDQAFKLWLQEVRHAWTTSPETGRLGSAHQMGTCRMSSSKEQGVTDGKGKVWDTEGVYVADASSFPSASGVNPMVTAMGISEWIARGIVTELEAESLE